MTSSEFDTDSVEAQIQTLGPEVLVDCGHTSISFVDGEYRFGKTGQPSITEVKTFGVGMELVRLLKSNGRIGKIHVCFSDSTRNLRDPSKRVELKGFIEDGSMIDRLPVAYREIVARSGLGREDISFSLQTRNSNVFSNRMKDMKKRFLALSGSEHAIFDEFHALFIKDADDDLFGFTTPFLFDSSAETQAIGGDWWLDSSYEASEMDLMKAPMLYLKQLRMINLHSKSSGILCPATYGGLLLGTQRPTDHIGLHPSFGGFSGQVEYGLDAQFS